MAVVLIIGVPGSGKTTFAKRLQKYCEGEQMKIDDCSLISFDAIEAEEDLVWDEKSFKLIRSKCLQRVIDAIRIQLSTVKSLSPHCNGSIGADADDDAVLVHTKNDGLIIVDDIMYLRSMRRELYVITRDHGVPLVTVWMKSCLDVCLDRNRSRNARISTSSDDNTSTSCRIDRHNTESIHSIDRNVQLVTDDTILRIHGAFEEPTSEFIFDRHHIVVDSDSNSEDSSLDHAIQWILATKSRLIEEHRSKSIARHVQESSSGHDVLMLSVTKELDEALRDIISKVMSEVTSLMKLKSRDNEDGNRVVEIILDDALTLSIDCGRYSAKDVGKLLSQAKSNILQLSRSSSSGDVRIEGFVELFINNVKEGLSYK